MTPYDPSSLSTVGRWLAQSPVEPFETSDAKGLARMSACIRVTSSRRNCSGRYMAIRESGFVKKMLLDPGTTRANYHGRNPAEACPLLVTAAEHIEPHVSYDHSPHNLEHI